MSRSAILPQLQANQVDNRSAAETVADALRRGILRGQIEGGERLRQDHIASQFGVSQMIVREAFKQLGSEGFLVFEPRRGVSVTPLSVDEAFEMTKLRSLLEAQALEWAIPNQSKDDIASAAQLLDELDVATTTDEVIALNAAFHETLYCPSQRHRTLRLIRAMRLNFERYLRFTWDRMPQHRAQSQAEHRRLLDLCRNGRSDEACALLREHITATGDLLTKSLRLIDRQNSQEQDS
ncbi:GntR family transcriptional regulator [Bosea sp. 685]|uniref:GntR family transcriptional regulator n=1 Tax=Bosea sp. 685 TaxID=3080057 RepID=UPI002892EEBA|nr:GntR family transcriptional regulator [Bosea sp. 685]WNJ90714.1 GntR family transcriptional regulator [Bosea sp. 685]